MDTGKVDLGEKRKCYEKFYESGGGVLASRLGKYINMMFSFSETSRGHKLFYRVTS